MAVTRPTRCVTDRCRLVAFGVACDMILKKTIQMNFQNEVPRDATRLVAYRDSVIEQDAVTKNCRCQSTISVSFGLPVLTGREFFFDVFRTNFLRYEALLFRRIVI